MEATDENEELRRFREDWKREVATRKRADTVLSSASVSSSTVPRSEPDLQLSISSPSDASYDDQNRLWPSNLSSAVEIYSEAVALEENGLLDAATQLYKRAFAVDSNVHKAYDRAVKSTLEKEQAEHKQAEHKQAEHKQAEHKQAEHKQAEQLTAHDLARRVARLNVAPVHTPGVAEGREQSDGRRSLDNSRSKIALAHLLSNVALPDANALSFMPPLRLPASSDAPAPEQPTDPAVLNALTPIRKLPDELLIHVLLFLIESPSSRRHHHHSHARSNSSAVTVPKLGEDDNWFAAPKQKPGLIAASNGATSIEQFARVCWKARVLTLDAGIWRYVGLSQTDANPIDRSTFLPQGGARRNAGLSAGLGVVPLQPLYWRREPRPQPNSSAVGRPPSLIG